MADKNETKSAEKPAPLNPTKSDDAVGTVNNAKTERDTALADRDAARASLKKANQRIEEIERDNATLRSMVHKLEAGAPAELPDGSAYVVKSVTFPRCDTGAAVEGKSGDIVVVAKEGEKGDSEELQEKYGAKHRVFPVTGNTLTELLDKHLARRGR